MAVYEYECKDCGRLLEYTMSFAAYTEWSRELGKECPYCHTQDSFKRVFSPPGIIIG